MAEKGSRLINGQEASPGEDDAKYGGRGEDEVELQDVDDLGHRPVQAAEGRPQRGQGRDDWSEGETGEQRGNQQRQVEEELKEGIY